MSRRNGAGYPLQPDTLNWWQVTSNEGLPQCESIVQVTGANIMEEPLTKERLKEHYDSRVNVTKTLAHCAKYLKEPPKVFIHASCVGIYPPDTDQVFSEDYSGEYANDFVGEMNQDMEEQARKSFGDKTRVVHLRFGNILGCHGPYKALFRFWPVCSLCLTLGYEF